MPWHNGTMASPSLDANYISVSGSDSVSISGTRLVAGGPGLFSRRNFYSGYLLGGTLAFTQMKLLHHETASALISEWSRTGEDRRADSGGKRLFRRWQIPLPTS